MGYKGTLKVYVEVIKNLKIHLDILVSSFSCIHIHYSLLIYFELKLVDTSLIFKMSTFSRWIEKNRFCRAVNRILGKFISSDVPNRTKILSFFLSFLLNGTFYHFIRCMKIEKKIQHCHIYFQTRWENVNYCFIFCTSAWYKTSLYSWEFSS